MVHRCHRKRDNLQVALKVWRTIDPEEIAIAEEEFRLLRSLNHPNIIGVLDFYQLPGKVFTILEFFEGCELGQAVLQAAEGRFSEIQSMRLSKALFSAVQYLHDQDVLHRDIKPENVRVDKSLSTLKLLDFNTSRRIRENAALTPTGTQLYAAPEVLLGESPAKEADVWGAGLCTYWMLTGELPQGRKVAGRCSARKAALRPIEFCGEKWQLISCQCKDVLASSLALTPFARADAEAILALGWFQHDGVQDVGPLDGSVISAKNSREVTCQGQEELPEWQPHQQTQQQTQQQQQQQQQLQQGLLAQYRRAKSKTITLEDLAKLEPEQPTKKNKTSIKHNVESNSDDENDCRSQDSQPSDMSSECGSAMVNVSSTATMTPTTSDALFED